MGVVVSILTSAIPGSAWVPGTVQGPLPYLAQSRELGCGSLGTQSCRYRGTWEPAVCQEAHEEPC